MPDFPITEVYIENGKIYWPDANINSEKYYELDWTRYLEQEVDAIDTVSWTVPALGITNMDEQIISLTKTRIKLSADIIGEYEIICTLNSEEGPDTQKHIKKMNLKVI